MTKRFTIGNDVFEYPAHGNGNWGEEATAWAEAVTEALRNVQGPNDIPVTSISLVQGAVDLPVPNLKFTSGLVLSVTVNYMIKRINQRNSADVIIESGELRANFNGTNWKVVQRSEGDSGIIFNVRDTGEFEYKDKSIRNRQTISAITNGDPTVITINSHNLVSGENVSVYAPNNTPAINGDYAVTVIDSNTFSIALETTASDATDAYITNYTDEISMRFYATTIDEPS